MTYKDIMPGWGGPNKELTDFLVRHYSGDRLNGIFAFQKDIKTGRRWIYSFPENVVMVVKEQPLSETSWKRL